MNKIFPIIFAGCLTLSVANTVFAADDAAKANYKAAKENATATYKAARTQCNGLSGNAKDVCIAEAKAEEKRSKANAEAQYQNTPEARTKASVEAAEADYDVAKEKCNAQAGNAKVECIKQAKDTYSHTKANTKSGINSEGAGNYVEDTVITTKVKAAFLAKQGLKSSEINVETFKGTVQLSGFVSSQANMDKAVAVARGIQGVTNVKNNMHLK